MKTLIHIHRFGSDGYRHSLPVIVQASPTGAVSATLDENIHRRITSTRYGEPEWITTFSREWSKGDTITLTTPPSHMSTTPSILG